MRIRRLLWLCLPAALAGCEAQTLAKRPPLPVRTVTATVAEHADEISMTGEIAARVSSNLSFRVSGRVIARYVDVGGHVEAGDVLARIDPAEAQADLDAANASVASAEAVLKQASVAFDRQKQLFDSGFATRPSFDTAQQNLRTAQSALDSAKAQAATAADALGYTELKAEKAGVIVARLIEVGQVATAAQTAFTMAEDGPRDAVFNVFESIFFARPSGRGLKLSLVADPRTTAIGHVREISPTVNSRTGTVTVKVAVDSPKPFPLGAPVIGRGSFAPRPVVALPWGAAASQEGKLAVWIYDPASGAVSLRPVTAESYDNETLLIAQGLKGGEAVVTEGTKFLYPGKIVAPQEAAK